MNRRILTTVVLALANALLTTLAPSLSLAQGLPSLGDVARQELSPVMERKLGEQIMRDIRRDRDYLNDAPVLEYLNRFGDILLSAQPDMRGDAGYDFRFFAVRDSALNAFALPGGFIAVHSALVLAAQSESELASVMAHEIGHVAQRHIARMVGQQHQDALIPLAATILAAIAARSSPDAAGALLIGGQGMSAQRQLNFSRDAEREADRVGVQMLRDAGFDTTGMIAFFGRLQTASRNYTDAVPAFLRSHPLTSERIADIQARTRDWQPPSRTDSIDFQLVRARLRVLQDETPQGLRNAKLAFEQQLQQKKSPITAAAQYGLSLIALKQREFVQAQSLLNQAAAEGPSAILASHAIDIKLAAMHIIEAVNAAEVARAQFPQSRGIARQYADALIAAARYEDAVQYLRDQAQLHRQEPELQDQLARAYAKLGKQALQHMALAELYAASGIYSSALDQFRIARKAPDASFYDLAIIDARERELQVMLKEEMQESQIAR